jgi:uncharacterized protein YeaO (DUF488 family)
LGIIIEHTFNLQETSMAIKIKRVYEEAGPGDGMRILVDRLWPRGLTKEKAGIDLWVKNLAPSNELRKWYSHDPQKWEEFKTKYFAELDSQRGAVKSLQQTMKKNPVTLLYSSKEKELNNAYAFKLYLEKLK